MFRSYIGNGYYGTITPTVIQRNILENPGWYTAYTPYQAEIAQGRLEALLNFQTMVTDMTGLPIEFSNDIFGVLLQYPATDGQVFIFDEICNKAHAAGALVSVATDLLSLAILPSPGEIGADIAIGNSQRFGVPIGYGGPHAAFISCSEKFKRKMPGRIIGVSVDQNGNKALRMALQTREQHIRRDRATSNICTAQVLLAVMAGMYAVYHGQKGIKQIAEKIHNNTNLLASSLKNKGYKILHKEFFDTIRISLENFSLDKIKERAEALRINLRYYQNEDVGISIDETCSDDDINDILSIFDADMNDNLKFKLRSKRKSEFLTHSIFNKYHSETEMMRYLHRLESKDLALNTSMIALGSCTMKLNAASEMIPISWPEFSSIHPFAPKSQTEGYNELASTLSDWLMKITGLDGCSLQPNSGAQGEYAGLLVIRAYHIANNDTDRTVCLIPSSAHGTNPASAVMAGMEVIVVDCDDHGNIDIDDLKSKSERYSKNLAALMVTYPSTHGVYEESISEVCEIIHKNGGQVYLDGANLNAMVGLSKLGEFGADVCHINLHKTFAIPHGGGGPGMGPICVAKHLKSFLPTHRYSSSSQEFTYSVSAAPLGSANILPISWGYILMLGDDGLRASTEVAILNANYMAKRLSEHYPILYKGANGLCAHEFIIDIRNIKEESGITEEDIAKRLIDYGFHAPTMSWPVIGTMMIEPTESESKEELDKFCDAMISIKNEINNVVNEKFSKIDNPLVNAPHTAIVVTDDNWSKNYSREIAAYPSQSNKEFKYWPSVGRVDNAHGDRNLICTCPPIDEYE